MNIRSATIDDFEALCAIDTVAKADRERRDQIRDWLKSAHCYVAEVNGQVAAYGVLNNHFFGHSFIEMVMIGEDFRRQGLGEKLLRYIQSIVPNSKLFSSTNASNVPMQTLFAKLGFKQSGFVDNLDEGDPEIIFYILTA